MQQFDLVIRNGMVVTPSDMFQADIGISDGRIAALAVGPLDSAETIDAGGLIVMPGGVDVHTHLDMPSRFGITTTDDYESGTIAAACGGITTIIDYAQHQAGRSLLASIAEAEWRAGGKAVIDYSFHMILAMDVQPSHLDEIPAIVERGYPSFKVYTIKELGVDDAGILRAMERIRDAGGLLNVHPENGEMVNRRVAALRARGVTGPLAYASARPAIVEAEATNRILSFADDLAMPVYIVHLSSQAALNVIRRARAAGSRVLVETRPCYLALTFDCYRRPGFESAGYVCAPPLREQVDIEALWGGLQAGDIQTVASDHVGWANEQKRIGLEDFMRIPAGFPQLEFQYPFMFSECVSNKRLSLSQLAAVMAANPARIFGMAPAKGTIAVGADADLVLFDPNQRFTVSASRGHSRSDFEPFEGMELQGRPMLTLARGDVIVRNGEYIGAAGRGRVVRRKPFVWPA